jgi:hypothetical protein
MDDIWVRVVRDYLSYTIRGEVNNRNEVPRITI